VDVRVFIVDVSDDDDDDDVGEAVVEVSVEVEDVDDACIIEEVSEKTEVEDVVIKVVVVVAGEIEATATNLGREQTTFRTFLE
jgi:hypothetical protein